MRDEKGRETACKRIRETCRVRVEGRVAGREGERRFAGEQLRTSLKGGCESAELTDDVRSQGCAGSCLPNNEALAI